MVHKSILSLTNRNALYSSERKGKRFFFFFRWLPLDRREEINVYTLDLYVAKEEEREREKKKRENRQEKCYELRSETTSISQSYKHTHHIDD